MKVKELIKQLKSLDQNDDIWVLTDDKFIEPNIDIVEPTDLLWGSGARCGDLYFKSE